MLGVLDKVQVGEILVSEQNKFPPQRANRFARFAPRRGDLFTVNLYNLDLSPRVKLFNKHKNKRRTNDESRVYS